MRTDRGFDRLVNFSDAVVAIALTLLILPLATIPAGAPKGEALTTMLSRHEFDLISFGISFVVIGLFWQAHHSLFEHIQAYDGRVMRINQLWLFTIVVLPFATELLNTQKDGRLANGIYVSCLLVSSACLSAIAWTVRRNPELRHPDSAATSDNQIDAPAWLRVVVLVVVLGLVVLLPVIGLWWLLLLVAVEPLQRLVVRRRTAPS